jgi:hypothetical protein
VRKAIRQSVVVAAAIFSSSVAADYVVNRVDYIDPDSGAVAPSSLLFSTNRNAQALGLATLDGGLTFFGFVYDPASGNFVRLPQPPGSDGITSGASASGINDAGVMTGFTFDPAFTTRGFTFANGVYTVFSNPGWANTTGRTIGNPTPAHPQGLVVGYVDDGLFETMDSNAGFVYDPATSTFAEIDGTRSFITIAHGQNAAGQITGSAYSDGTVRARGIWAFLFTPTTAGEPMLGGSTTFFRVPGTIRSNYARGINDKNLIAAVALDPSGSPRTYVGTIGSFQRIEAHGITGPTCPDGTTPGMFAEHLTNTGQVLGNLTDSSCATHGFFATPASMPTGTTRNGASTFSVDVVAGQPTFISLPVAPAFDYRTGKHDPRIAAVRLPLGIGNNKFVLVVRHRAFAVNAGQLFDFRAQGLKHGVKAFRVACIGAIASADPAYVPPFPTELTFAAAGKFTGTQRPLAVPATMTQAQCRELLLAQRNPDGPDDEDDEDD